MLSQIDWKLLYINYLLCAGVTINAYFLALAVYHGCSKLADWWDKRR